MGGRARAENRPRVRGRGHIRTKEDRPGFQLILSEVAKIRPNTLIAWKTDRLGRDKYVLAMAKKTIRDAGCEIHLLAENIPTDTAEGILIEG